MTACLRNLSATSPAHTVLLLLTVVSATGSSMAQQQPAPVPTARSPHDWAMIAAANEIRAITHDTSFLRYQVRTVDQKGERLRDVVEYTGGSVARLLERDGKVLTPEENAAERDRLGDLLKSPSDFARHARSDATDKKLATDLLQLMPAAMIYTLAPDQPATPPANNTSVIVLDFAPNPAWNPPTTPAEGLTGLRGRMWIDQKSGYVVRMDGEIFRPVNFGYGMVARVYPGGHLSLTQVSVGADRWIYSHFEEHIRVRALMFKTLDINTSIDTGHHQPAPGPLTWQEAIQLLLR